MPTYRQAGRRGAAGQRRRDGLVEVDARARPVLPRPLRRGRAPAAAGSGWPVRPLRSGRSSRPSRRSSSAGPANSTRRRSGLVPPLPMAETETDNVWLQGWSNEDLALVLERAGRIDEAREALERALAVWERKRCLPSCVAFASRSIRSGGRRSDTLKRHSRTLGQADAAVRLDILGACRGAERSPRGGPAARSGALWAREGQFWPSRWARATVAARRRPASPPVLLKCES